VSSLRFFVVAGPTAVGKSDFAVDVAERLGTEIVGADAFQIYEGFQILSGKPSAALQSRIRHHLIGTLPVKESCDAARYAAVASEKIHKLNQRGLTPIVVGGSGFYIAALLNPLPDLPPSDPDIRNDLGKQPLKALLSELQSSDPETFDRIDQHNRRRVERALEVIRMTGKPFSSYRASKIVQNTLPGMVLTRPRKQLHQRIEHRVRWMLENGAIQEVATVGELSSTAAQMIGVPEIRKLLRQEISSEECIQTVQAATRQYAKRQITWFKKQPFVQFDAEAPVAEAVEFFRRQERRWDEAGGAGEDPGRP
jgi:tRNA dimethylallyltransferase